MRRAPLAALLLLACAAAARAAFEDLGAGARATGLGGAFVPVADDVYTLYYNPAGLGLLERPQLGTAYTLLYPGLQDGSSLGSSFLGYAQPLKEGRQGTLAAGWTALSLNSLYREDAFYLGYGRRWLSAGGGSLYGGVNLKELRRSFGSFPEADNAVPANGVVGGGQPDPLLGGRRSRSALDTDAGLLYRLDKHYSVGLDVMHVNAPDVAFGSQPDRLPRVIKLGFGYRSLLSNLAAEYDTQRSPLGGQDHSFTAAAERWFPKLFLGDFGVRGALSLGSRDFKQASAGVSYRTRRLGVDYSMSLPIGGVSTTFAAHRVGLSFRFGRRTEDEESLELVLEAMKRLKGGQAPQLAASDFGGSDTARRGFEELAGRARSLEAHAKYAEAASALERALTLAPGDKALVERYGRLSFIAKQIRSVPDYRSDPMQASLHLGIMAYVNGDGPGAVKQVAYAAAQAPERRDLDAFLTQLEVAAGVSRSVFGKPSLPDHQAAVALTKADAALEDGDYSEAVEQSLAVLRIDPNSAQAWENLGTAFFALKQYRDSLRSWNRAFELEKSPAIRAAIRGYIKSVTRAQERRPSAAPAPRVEAPALPERPALSPQEASVLFNRAVDYYTRRDFKQAQALLEQILAADPGNVEAQKALRRIKEEQP